jgi:acyl carrier protein
MGQRLLGLVRMSMLARTRRSAGPSRDAAGAASSSGGDVRAARPLASPRASPPDHDVTLPRGPRELHGWLVHALTRRAQGFSEALTDDTPLTEGGLCLDSLALIDLIAEIEDTLMLRLHETEISAENFGTPGLLLRFLERRMGAAPALAFPRPRPAQSAPGCPGSSW